MSQLGNSKILMILDNFIEVSVKPSLGLFDTLFMINDTPAIEDHKHEQKKMSEMING